MTLGGFAAPGMTGGVRRRRGGICCGGVGRLGRWFFFRWFELAHQLLVLQLGHRSVEAVFDPPFVEAQSIQHPCVGKVSHHRPAQARLVLGVVAR